MVDYWNGPEASHWLDRETGFDAMLAPFVEPILDAAAIGPGDHVVDVGCGNGALTRAAATRAARATGVDISGPMIARARERAAAQGIDNVEFVEADAQTHSFAHDADAIVSRFGVMFFDDPVAAFANLRRTLRPGGRCTFVCWQGAFANEWVAVAGAALIPIVGPPDLPPPEAPGPFAFADPHRVTGILADAGFESVDLDELRIPILLGGGLHVDDAVAFMVEGGMGKRFLAGAEAAVTAEAVAAARDALAPFDSADGVRMGSAAWLVRAAG